MVQGEELSEQNLLVPILYSRVLFIELFLNFVELSRVDLLYRCIDIQLRVPASANVLKHHSRSLNFADPRQAIL